MSPFPGGGYTTTMFIVVLSANQGNSIISYYQGESHSFGQITQIFTVADPLQNITGYFLVLNIFKIFNEFLPSWPHLDVYRAERSNLQTIIKCEEIDCHCALYSFNGLILLTKLHLSEIQS